MTAIEIYISLIVDLDWLSTFHEQSSRFEKIKVL